MQGSKHVFVQIWKYLCKKRVTYLNILINIVFCKDIFHFVSFSEAKVASSAFSWSFFTLRSRHRSGVKTLLMGVRVHCFPLISIRLIQIQTKQLSNVQKKSGQTCLNLHYSRILIIGSSRNSISWMKKSRSTFSQEDGTLRYYVTVFQAVHLGLIHQCSSKAEAHIFWLRLEKKKHVGTMQSVMSKKLIWLKSY